MRKMTLFAAALVGALWAVEGWADATGVWSVGDHREVVLKYRDVKNFRFHVAPKEFRLREKGDLYLVMEGADGHTRAVKVDETNGHVQTVIEKQAKLLQELGEVRFRDTGRRETVAGLEGIVYEASFRAVDGTPQREELVLSKAPAVVELQRYMFAVIDDLGDIAVGPGRNPLSRAMLLARAGKDLGGLLRFGDLVKLEAVDHGRLADGQLQLPKDAVAVRMRPRPDGKSPPPGRTRS
jgi:hypothetical protein